MKGIIPLLKCGTCSTVLIPPCAITVTDKEIIIGPHLEDESRQSCPGGKWMLHEGEAPAWIPVSTPQEPKQVPGGRKPAFVNAESHIVRMVIGAMNAVKRQNEGDAIGTTLALNAVKAEAQLAISFIREGETGNLSGFDFEGTEFETMLQKAMTET